MDYRGPYVQQMSLHIFRMCHLIHVRVWQILIMFTTPSATTPSLCFSCLCEYDIVPIYTKLPQATRHYQHILYSLLYISHFHIAFLSLVIQLNGMSFFDLPSIFHQPHPCDVWLISWRTVSLSKLSSRLLLQLRLLSLLVPWQLTTFPHHHTNLLKIMRSQTPLPMIRKRVMMQTENQSASLTVLARSLGTSLKHLLQ